MSNFITNDNNFFLTKNYIGSYNLYSYDLFLSVILTQFYYVSVYFMPYFNEFFKHLVNSVEYSNMYHIHPEIYFVFKDYSNHYSVLFTESIISIYLDQISETFIHPLFILLEIVSFFMLLLYFVVIYFSYYGNSTSEDNLIDHDYLVTSLTVESEEEISSFDDTILALVILTLLFL